MSTKTESETALQSEKKEPLDNFSGDVLFCCQTPLHFLLISSLSRIWNGRVNILWISECDIDERLVEKAKRTSDFRLLSLPGGSRVQNKILRMLTRSLNVLRLRFFDLTIRNQSLVVFNDITPETQYLINSFHSHGGRVFLGEDGIATYPTGGVVPAGFLSRVLGKILYGAWWCPKPRIGLNSMISGLFASYPKLIRNDVKEGKQIFQLPRLKRGDLSSSFSINIEGRLICIMPLFSSVSNEITIGFTDVLRTTRQDLAIKFHPREDPAGRRHIEALLDNINYFVIPQETPIETICLTSYGLKGIVGHRSSALHLIKFLRPDLKVNYIEIHEDAQSEAWRAFFQQVGVSNFMTKDTSI